MEFWFQDSAIILLAPKSSTFPATPDLIFTSLEDLQIIALIGMSGWAVRLQLVGNPSYIICIEAPAFSTIPRWSQVFSPKFVASGAHLAHLLFIESRHSRSPDRVRRETLRVCKEAQP